MRPVRPILGTRWRLAERGGEKATCTSKRTVLARRVERGVASGGDPGRRRPVAGAAAPGAGAGERNVPDVPRGPRGLPGCPGRCPPAGGPGALRSLGARSRRGAVHHVPSGGRGAACRLAASGGLLTVPQRPGRAAGPLDPRAGARPGRSARAALRGLSRDARHPLAHRSRGPYRGGERARSVRVVSSRGIPGLADAQHPAGFHPGELLQLDARGRAAAAWAHGDGRLHLLPHGARHPPAHRLSVQHQPEQRGRHLPPVSRADRAGAPGGHRRAPVGSGAPQDPRLRGLPLASSHSPGLLRDPGGQPGLPGVSRSQDPARPGPRGFRVALRGPGDLRRLHARGDRVRAVSHRGDGVAGAPMLHHSLQGGLLRLSCRENAGVPVEPARRTGCAGRPRRPNVRGLSRQACRARPDRGELADLPLQHPHALRPVPPPGREGGQADRGQGLGTGPELRGEHSRQGAAGERAPGDRHLHQLPYRPRGAAARGSPLRRRDQCGRCHETEATTFFDTFHGKVSRLGDLGAAKCYDCHGTHNILPVTEPVSTLSRRNIQATCSQCHTGVNRRFVGYLTPATHHASERFPYLFWTFWAMTGLLAGTLTFATGHTLAWLWRLWRTPELRPQRQASRSGKQYQRFNGFARKLHGVMLLSFFTLALTGMVLKFSYMGWAQGLSALFGGFSTTGVLHRIAALTLITVFLMHLWDAWRKKRRSGRTWLQFITASDSLVFTWQDAREFWQSIKWFFGRGPRPRYGRYTYWEKFDYFAVFWGMLIIGSTGLLLWFPEFFTLVLPGQAVNIATILHSDEALLAVAFIFTVHFFNTHFRPDKFPMDPVIFTGQVSLEDLERDKPREYEELVREGKLEEHLVDPYPWQIERWFRIFAYLALAVGISLVVLIVYSMVFGYR